MAINSNAYVSWPVSGGVAFGKVSKLSERDFEFAGSVVKASKDDPIAEIVLPSDQVVYIAQSGLTEISESDYKDHLSSLAELFSKKAGINMTKEIETIQADLKIANEKIAALTSEKATLETSIAALNTDLATAKLDVTKANDELANIRKAALAKTRLDTLAALNATSAVDADETKALAKLGDMNEDVFNMILSVAKTYDEKAKADQAAKDAAATASESTKETVTAALDAAKSEGTGSDVVLAGAGNSEEANPLVLAFKQRYGVKE